MIETLISSKTRIKLLLKFFLNSSMTAYLRGLETEFGESTNSIRLELNKMEKAGMLTSSLKGNKKIFQANKQYPLFNEIHSILLKHIGIDSIIQNVIERLGQVEEVYLAGQLAKGLNSQIVDLIIVGNIDKTYLIRLIEKSEDLVNRKIRFINYLPSEFDEFDLDNFEPKPLLLWSNDKEK